MNNVTLSSQQNRQTCSFQVSDQFLGLKCSVNKVSQVGLLIFVFYFTSKNLLYYQHLLVNTEQHSKKDLVCEQVEMI